MYNFLPDLDRLNPAVAECIELNRDTEWGPVEMLCVDRDVTPGEWRVWSAEFRSGWGTAFMPVSMTNADNTIYGDALANALARFWHDLVHLKTGLDFSLESEIKVSMIQLDQLWSVTDNLDVITAVEADTIGQQLYYLAHGEFPEDQRKFCLEYMNGGIARHVQSALF